MIKFLTEYDFTRHAFRLWRSTSQFIVIIGGVMISIPAGEVTDLGSIPRICWLIILPTDYPEPFAIHDFIYRSGMWSREQADLWLYDLLLFCDCPKWKAAAVYRAVRMFGWIAWNGHRKAKQPVETSKNL